MNVFAPDEQGVIYAVDEHIEQLHEIWQGLEIIELMLEKNFLKKDIDWVCKTMAKAIDFKICDLNDYKNFINAVCKDEVEVRNANKEEN